MWVFAQFLEKNLGSVFHQTGQNGSEAFEEHGLSSILFTWLTLFTARRWIAAGVWVCGSCQNGDNPKGSAFSLKEVYQLGIQEKSEALGLYS